MLASSRSGAIRRASIEKDSNLLTYENFVTELDSGDAFTTSIIDILVKEVADRRARTNVNDRKLLSERTVRSLRHLASHSRTYSSRPPGRSHGRRAQQLTEYFTAAHELDMEDDDDFGDPVAENATTIEGAQVNSNLFEAYTSSSSSATAWPTLTRRITASPSPISEDWPTVRSPPSSSTRPWTITASGSNPSLNPTSSQSNLSRQASIRRAARSRMVDFNDFTHRRRSAARDAGSSRPDGPSAETVTEPRDSSSSQTVRRFFPFPRPSRRPQNQQWSDFLEPPSPDSSDDPVQFFSVEPNWYDTVIDSRASPDEESREETENLLRAPRLRRGGVRAPESMLSRHASPIPITTPPIETVSVIPPSLARREEVSSNSTLPIIEEPVAYPTPGSTENENVA
ncbi:hypothetical protein CVT26_006186 [Gymnopilus dilepis]|uniref:Uncharacterized protein n=1 Tax=Gymnopilus dilepis TaxID=231916 RepID=A0A409VPS3_9AGAR|nr:hypothetical protein CVT26_006186 [Gymnopilus dilepis]